jgi:iron complex outermembrane recepter protein
MLSTGRKPRWDMRFSRGNVLTILAIGMSSVGLAVYTARADEPPSGTKDADGLQEIVVTARFRSENIMKVPDTVQAFSAEEITEKRLTQLSDFIQLTPNAKMIVEQDMAQTEIYIRGVGSNKSQLPAVAFVVDGVILPDNDAFTMDLSDAQQVEILKGPQGALYGKGALAGVVNITTRQPTNTPSVDAKIDFGSNSTYGGFAAVNGPLITDYLFAGLQASYHNTQGPFLNHYNDRGFESNEDGKITGKLIGQPIDALRLTLDLSYYRQSAGLPPYNGVNVLGTGSTEITPAEAGAPIDQDCSIGCKTNRDVVLSAFTAAWDLGPTKLTSITAFDEINVGYNQDIDFTQLDIVNSYGVRKTRSISQEFRLASTTDGVFHYNFSTYFQHENYYLNTIGYFDFCFLGVATCSTRAGTPSGILTPDHLNQTDTLSNAYAVAGQVSYDITSELELTAALRYDDDKPTQYNLLNGPTQSTSFAEWQPKVSLAYKPYQDLMIYSTYSRGFKPGVFNPPQAPGSPFPTLIKKEVTDNIELGVKTSAFDRRLVATAAAFYTNYTDPQEFHLDVQSGGNEAINVNKAHIVGLEAELAGRPMRNLDLNADFGYTKSNIVDFNGTSEYVGQSLPYQPRYTVNLAAQYTVPLDSQTDMKLRADWKWDGRTSFQDFQDPNPNQFLTQASDETLDLNLTFVRGRWALNFFGNNVLNSRYVVSAYSRYIIPFVFAPLNEDVLLRAPGVIWGGQLRYSF